MQASSAAPTPLSLKWLSINVRHHINMWVHSVISCFLSLPEVKSLSSALFSCLERGRQVIGSSMICLSKMAAHGTGFPPLCTMGSGDKEHHLQLLIKKPSHLHRCVCTDASLQLCNTLAMKPVKSWTSFVMQAFNVERQSLTCPGLWFICVLILIIVFFFMEKSHNTYVACYVLVWFKWL